LRLDLSAEVAARRKPGDAIGERAVRRQLEAYALWLPRLPGAVGLDATRPPDELAAEAFALVLEGPHGPM